MIRFLSVVVLSLSLLALPGCCSCKEAESAVRDAISINKGHMNDGTLPEEAHLIAQDNYDLDWKILFGIGAIKEGEIPEDVRARQAARATPPAGATPPAPAPTGGDK